MNEGMSLLDDRSRIDPAPSWLSIFEQPVAALERFRRRRTLDVGPPFQISLIPGAGLTRK